MKDSVLVTGAATGLGREMALYLAERDFQVYATIRDCGKPRACTLGSRPQGPSPCVADGRHQPATASTRRCRRLSRKRAAIYGVINNAGIGLRGYFEDLADEEIRQVFDANVFGVMAVTKAVLPYMRKARRGRIILISSVGGRIGSLGVSAYCATKFAVEGFGESLFQELAPLGVSVVLIEPGIIKTERWTTNRGLAKSALDPRARTTSGSVKPRRNPTSSFAHRWPRRPMSPRSSTRR